MNKHVKAWRNARVSTIHCENWNPSMDDGAQALTDKRTGASLGSLIPVDEELVANSPGIQSWSKRGGTRSGRVV